MSTRSYYMLKNYKIAHEMQFVSRQCMLLSYSHLTHTGARAHGAQCYQNVITVDVLSHTRPIVKPRASPKRSTLTYV